MTNWRNLRTTDDKGRVAYPSVVDYEISQGPDKGRRFITPPRHGDARPNEEGQVCYFVRVYDRAAYDELERSGFLYSPEHCGPVGLVEDNRPAPGA